MICRIEDERWEIEIPELVFETKDIDYKGFEYRISEYSNGLFGYDIYDNKNAYLPNTVLRESDEWIDSEDDAHRLAKEHIDDLRDGDR